MIPFYVDYDERAVLVNSASDFGEQPIPPIDAEIDYEGEHFYVWRFELENVLALRAVGVDVPSPIRTDYEFPKVNGRHTPRDLQLTTAEFLTLHQRAYCLNQIGTGKTYSTAVAADYLLREGFVRRVIVVSPLSTLTPVWADTIYRTLPHRTFSVLHAAADKRRKMFAADRDFYIVNHDGLEILTKNEYNHKKMLVGAKLMRNDVDLFILDELGFYRHTDNNRWHHMARLLSEFPDAWVWGLTGTPTPNRPTDAYGQIKLITPERAPKFAGTFRDMTMFCVNPTDKMAGAANIEPPIYKSRPEANQIVARMMQPSVCFPRKGNVNIEDTIYTPREVQFTAEQTKRFKEMQRTFVTEFENGQIVTAVNAGVKLSKLLQIAGGVVFDQEGEPVAIGEGAKPRLREVLDIMDQCDEKVLIYAHYRPIEAWLFNNLKTHSRGAIINGAISKKQRDTIFREFQDGDDLRWIVADPRCMSHGLTLTRASTIIWFGPPMSNDTYTQANGRIERDGQVAVPNVLNLYGCNVEKKRYDALMNSTASQDQLLEMMRDGEALL